MANYCNYEVHVKGKKNAALMLYYSMPSWDEIHMGTATGNDQNYEIEFAGNCKWSVNLDVIDAWNGQVPRLNSLSAEKIKQIAKQYKNCSLRLKSELFGCEIKIHYWSKESGFNQLDYYQNGKCTKRRKIAWDSKKITGIDWDKIEFVGCEGVFDPKVCGEENDRKLVALIRGIELEKLSALPIEEASAVLSQNNVQKTTTGNLPPKVADKPATKIEEKTAAVKNKMDEAKFAKMEKELRSYRMAMDSKLKDYLRDWGNFEKEVSDNISRLIIEGMSVSKPSSSSSRYDDGLRMSFSIGIHQDREAAEKYAKTVPTLIENKIQRFMDAIEEIDKKLIYYRSAGIVGSEFAELIQLLNRWAMETKKLKFHMGDNVLGVTFPSETDRMIKDWLKFEKEDMNQAEADRYGVAAADLETHKYYLDAIKIKESAQDSIEMKQAETMFHSLGKKGYLDSKELEYQCSAMVVDMKKKEDLTIKEENEKMIGELDKLDELGKKYDEERKKWRTKVSEINRLRASYVEKKIKIDQEKIEQYKLEQEKGIQEKNEQIEHLRADEQNVEQKLSALLFFQFSAKKELNTQIAMIRNKIQAEEDNLKKLKEAYRKEVERKNKEIIQLKSGYEYSAKTEYPTPKEPQKPAELIRAEKIPVNLLLLELIKADSALTVDQLTTKVPSLGSKELTLALLNKLIEKNKVIAIKRWNEDRYAIR